MAHQGQETTSASRSSIWFGVAGGPAAWTAHLAVGYLLITIDCMVGLTGIQTWLLITAAVAMLINLAAAVLSYRIWRGPGNEESTEADGPPGRHAMSGLAGLTFSAVFGFAIILGATSSVLLEPCA